MKKVLLSFCLLIIVSFSAFSQTTYLVDTAFTTDIGYNGAPASCVFTGGTALGTYMERSLSKWLADSFTIPSDTSWTFDTVIVYGYQINSGLTSTFANCNLIIYDGTPGLGGSVIWGDSSTNVLVNTDFTGIYRVDTVAADGGLTGNLDPIMYLKLYLNPAPHLNSGTYWLAWSTQGILNVETVAPPKVLPGRVNPTGQNAREFYNGQWNYALDHNHSLGMNKIIKASAATEAIPQIPNKSYGRLKQNIPNPFTISTTITFNLEQSGYTRLSIYNAIGQLVTTLVDGYKSSGIHQVTFNTNNIAAGIYYYQLNTTNGTENRSMLLVK